MSSVFPCQAPLFWLRIIHTVQHFTCKLCTEYYLDALLYHPENVLLLRFCQPVVRPCCGSSRATATSSAGPSGHIFSLHVCTKENCHSNLNTKSLLCPWWHCLWHAYQRAGCDVYVVEFILTRSCRSMALRRFLCESCKTIEGDTWLQRSKRKGQGGKNLEIWLLSFIRNMQIGAWKKGIRVEWEFHLQVLPCMQMY